MSEEQEQWKLRIEELQALGVTLEMIAERLGVGLRTVSSWKEGHRPTGMIAVNLHAFHMERCRTFQCNPSHSAEMK